MLKSGAAIGGLVWAVPVVQAVSMTPAHAATTSAPPSAVKGTSGEVTQAGGDAGQSTLPRTGADVGPIAAVGAGAVVLGGAVVAAARKSQPSPQDPGSEPG